MTQTRKKNFKKILFIIIPICLVTFTCGFYLYYIYNKIVVKSTSEDLGLSTITKSDLKNYKNYDNISNIALFGIDSTDYENGRCDCIMILTIDTFNNKLKLSSISRDSVVKIDNHGNDKLNYSYNYGGAITTLQTINKNFGLEVAKFVSVNFSSLPKIIDSIGGIELNITTEEIPFIDNIDEPGLHILNGDQSLSYSGIRDIDGGDISRTSRQRNVINSLYSKLINTSLDKIISLIKELLPSLQTNLTLSEILGLCNNILSISAPTIEEARFPLSDFYTCEKKEGICYLTVDLESTKNHLREFIYN